MWREQQQQARPARRRFADGKTFTLALASDPGALDPQGGAGSSLLQLSTFAYDSLVGVDPKTGDIVKQLATSWKVDGTTVTFELGSGITCADGSSFDAKTVVDNISYVETRRTRARSSGSSSRRAPPRRRPARRSRSSWPHPRRSC